jgi:outer membrane receptor protein involved in Fe transport
VRLDHFGGVEQTLVQPRLTSRLELASSFTVKGGAGLYSQQPSIDELVAPFGNPDLLAERASHFSFGLELRALPHLNIDLTGFYKRLSQLVSRTEAVAPDPAGGPARRLQFDNGGLGRVYGAELTVRHEPFAGFSGWLAYTLSRSLRTDGGQTEERLFDFDQTHILTAVASYAFGRNWQLGGRFRLVSGNPRTPVIGASFNNGTDAYDPVYGAVNSERHGPFHQLDLRLDKRWVYQHWMLNLYLEVQNVYDRKNPEGVSYSFDFRESKAQAGLPILPILGLKAEF